MLELVIVILNLVWEQIINMQTLTDEKAKSSLPTSTVLSVMYSLVHMDMYRECVEYSAFAKAASDFFLTASSPKQLLRGFDTVRMLWGLRQLMHVDEELKKNFPKKIFG